MDTGRLTPTADAALQRPLALVLSGGGAQGAAQAGAVVELRRSGILPDLVIGTSVGAWNGAWVAADTDVSHVERLVDLWLDPALRVLFRGVVRGFISGLARRRIAALGDAGIRRLLERHLGGIEFADLAIPLAVSAIDVLTAELHYLDSGAVASAVQAASAIPSLLPPVARDGRLLVDAGFVDNFGVAEAIRRGARSVVLLDASVGRLGASPQCIPSILDRANLVSRIHQRRFAAGLAAASGVRLEIVELAACGGGVLDFRSAAPSIEHGRAQARRWLTATGARVPAARATPPVAGAETPVPAQRSAGLRGRAYEAAPAVS